MPLSIGPTTTEVVLDVGTVCETDGDPKCKADLRLKLIVHDANGTIFRYTRI